MSVVCCVALRCLLSIPSWALGLAWSYVSSHISTGGGPDLPGHKKVSPFIQSDTGFPAREVFLFTSSYHRHHCNIIISEAGLMWGYVPGLGRIGVTSPPLLASLPAQCLRTHYHCAYEQQYVFYKNYMTFFSVQKCHSVVGMFWVMDSIPRVRCASGNVLKAASTAVYLSFMTISVFDFNFDQRLSNTYIFWVHNRSNMPMFCLKKNHFSALGGPDVAIFGPNDLHPMY